MTTPTSSPHAASQPLAALAIISSREDLATLSATVAAAVRAAHGAIDRVDVLVNGNLGVAQALAQRIGSFGLGSEPLHLRVWRFKLGDKAHTWNEYLERIAPPGRDCFFVDGYAAVAPDALRHMKAMLDLPDMALAVTGVPTVGFGARRMAQVMKTQGGIHGNLFALKSSAANQMRKLGFRLPLGLYRTDATVGAALALGLDLSERTWQPLKRIHVCTEAHWKIQPLRWWHPRDLNAHWRRYRRQAQGSLENAAVRYSFHVKQEHFGSLPRTAADMVRAWADAVPAEFEQLVGSRAFAREAVEQMMAPRDWSASSEPPELFAEARTPQVSDIDSSPALRTPASIPGN